ncbi:MAG TPA: pyridoxal-5'-phosphate-dependent protein subunit beta [Deltaproteobacteria bacterium]|nr:pyridoxal-5'-phosphate-dependent protein subunit beta [Deltaproteobacteria bacterium]HCP46551.1 pyridoxal-5'-phosphate-dependent protein subunit beta [Deltaproteobacteria bacterium]
MALPLLPTLEELLHPEDQPEDVQQRARACEDPLDPIQLFNMTWRNDEGRVEHRILPRALTGTRANIVVMSGRLFPTGSHKVGPAYSCLREGLLSGAITEDGSTLVFPSTGNYGIGGAWVGPRVGFRSLVVLPEEMSEERFQKIRGYGAEHIATPGSESNVKEIYDKVAELRRDPANRILNQFEDFGNYRFHHHVTGGSAVELAQELESLEVSQGGIAAFVSAMGSGGTIAAADRIQQEFPDCKVVGVEPIQCPTLYNVGFGAHAIEGIGDKHVTWIHNVRNMDLLVCIDDQQCLEGLQLLQEGRNTLASELGLAQELLDSLDGVFGISGVCNILAAIKTARHYDFDRGQTVFTVATDGFDRYPSVLRRLERDHGPMTPAVATRRMGIFLEPDDSYVQEGTETVRRRWHNQKYFTWVEQQGKSVAELEALWEPTFWTEQAARVTGLDRQTLAHRS